MIMAATKVSTPAASNSQDFHDETPGTGSNIKAAPEKLHSTAVIQTIVASV